MWFGILGGVGGTLIGLLGALAGTFAPRGVGRRWILGGMYAALALGAASLVVGVVALALGQPYGIWYPFLLFGLILMCVLGMNLPAIRRRYREAESRRLDAEGLRGL